MAVVACRFRSGQRKRSFFFPVPAKNPRTLCCCQSVACIISAMLAPSAWLSSVSRRSCLVTRSRFGSSLFGGALAVVAADVTLRRAVALDLTLLFLDAAVLRFRDFARGGVDIFRLRWFAAPDLTLARPKAPQIARRALPCADGGPNPPADAHSNAYYAAEVQSVLLP